MPVHNNWAQNRQATAVCDFCNRRSIPLQKCQDCNINICRDCTSKATLENDPRHRLASDAADSFDWHQWGKEKKANPLPSVQRIQHSSMPVETPVPEPRVWTGPFQPQGGHSGYVSSNGNLQYPSALYSYPTSMMYKQQYSHALPGSQFMGVPPDLGQYPPVFQYPFSQMHGSPSGPPLYNDYVPQQPLPYGLYSPQLPQPSSYLPGPANVLVSPALRRAPPSSSNLPAQSQDIQGRSRAPSEQSTTQSPQAPPPTPVFAYSSVGTTQNENSPILQQPLAPLKDAQLPGQSPSRQQTPQPTTDTSEQSSSTLKNTKTSRQVSEPSRQTVRGSKRARETSSEASRQGSSKNKGVGGPSHQPTKRSRRENAAAQATERPGRSHATSHARVLKRSRQDSRHDDKDGSRSPLAQMPRHDGNLGPTRIVKLRVNSPAGVQRLREILGTSQSGSRGSSSTVQNSLVSLPSSSSSSRSSLSTQALKKKRLDELLEASVNHPVPWPVPDQPTGNRLGEHSRQLFAKPGGRGGQEISAARPMQGPRGSDEADDIEAREAAMILLNMSHAR